jgi:hypothetical protein
VRLRSSLRGAVTPHIPLGADQCPQTLVQGMIGVARSSARLYSTQMTVKAMAWAASRCLASLVMKGIVSPEAV